ncbi:MAG TPA: hypothetical protein VFX17_01905 [Patescibacteria group bacterium]|nr:hypothetical protein [Patescibacteria group bacterium]
MDFKSRPGIAVLSALVLAIGFLSWSLSRSAKSGVVSASDLASESAQQIHSQCETLGQNEFIFECYSDVLNDYMRSTDARQTLQLLDSLQSLGGYAQANCHPLTHKLGNLALDYYGSVLTASQYYLPICYFGYYHGIVEEYISTQSDMRTALTTACGVYDDSNPSENYAEWYQCGQGLGHGIMEYEQDNVLKSLQDCDLLDPSFDARKICYSGVFADDVTGEGETNFKSALLSKDYINVCNQLPENYKQQCLNAKTS